MVTSKQIVKGIGMFIDTEILPAMGGAARYGAAVASAMGAKWAEGKLEQFRGTEIAKELGIVVDGGFDLDALRTAMVEKFPEEGLRIEAAQINRAVNHFLGKLGPILNVQMEGGITFRRTDIEKLYQYIMGG